MDGRARRGWRSGRTIRNKSGCSGTARVGGEVQVLLGEPEKRQISTKKSVFFSAEFAFRELNVLMHAKLLRS